MWVRPGELDLTYCTNVHSGEHWEDVRSSVYTCCQQLKQGLSPNEQFGIGLRLSAAAAEELLRGSMLEEFRSYLDGRGMYVALLNGFPYGSFHHASVKSSVFEPDWRSQERLRYTLNLAEILSRLLPAGMDGGISTLPLTYKPWMSSDCIAAESLSSIMANLVDLIEVLARLHAETGCLIHLDIEPEPDGLLENTDELIQFFHEQLLSEAVPVLAGRMQVSHAEARRFILEHLRVCFDTCHASVEYENLTSALYRLKAAGIKIGRIQLSSALCAQFAGSREEGQQIRSQLLPFAESVYLHQVIERRANGDLAHYVDLADALAGEDHDVVREWRIHYHVPIFTGRYGDLTSDQNAIEEVLREVLKGNVTQHLEIETYTWEVLPDPMKTQLVPSIIREYQWVLQQIGLQDQITECTL